MKRVAILFTLAFCALAARAPMAAPAKAPTPATKNASSASSAPAKKPAPAAPAAAAKDAPEAGSAFGLGSIGASIGMISPQDLGSTFGLGAFADLGTVAPNVGLEARIDYWSNSENAYGFETSMRDISVGARAKYFFELAGTNLRPYAGGGLSAHFLHAEVTIPAFFGLPSMTTSQSDTKVGIDLGGGFATAVSPRYDLVGDAWFGIVSNLNQLSLRVGLAYKLGS